MATLIYTHNKSKISEYGSTKSAVFLKTKERLGALSNMAGGFPLEVNGIKIRTSEALYQACRFPHLPEVQRRIIAERSPMTAKMKSKPHRQNSRSDWDSVRVKIMRWCLRVKLVQNWNGFRDALLETGDLPIVELSRRDDFWGAKLMGNRTLVGTNTLGRLLMELREQIKKEPSESFQYVEPLSIPDFLLGDRPIEKIYQISNDNLLWMSNTGGERPIDVRMRDSENMVVEASADSTTVANCKRININTARADVLHSYLGITLKQAERIKEHREDKGPFLTPNSVLSVRSIGEKTYQKIADKITIGQHTPNAQLSFVPDFQ